MAQDAEKYTMQAGEVAEKLSMSRQTVHNLAEAGVFTYVEKPRGTVPWKYFNPEEVEAFAEKRSTKPA